MNSYFAYIRVSTVRQGEHGSSLQEQRKAIEAYASGHGLTVTKWFEEMETAAKEGRRAFSDMLTELHRSRSTGLIVHKIDRSARNLRDWSQVIDLIDKGIEVHFAHDNVDLRTRGGRLTADIQAVIATDYIRNLREEVIKGIRGRLNQGIWPFPAPFGYQNCGAAKPKTIDPLLGPLVRETFQLYASGDYALDALRREMARRGLLRYGRPLSVNATAQLIRNPFYMGIMRLARTGDLFPGIHEPLISKMTFDQAQGVMNGRLYKGSGKHHLLFTRRIQCRRCKRILVGERQRGNVYYRCHSSICRGTSLNETTILDTIGAILEAVRLSPEEMRDLRDMRDELVSQGETERSRWIDGRRMLLGRCEDRLRRLADALADGDMDREVYRLRQAELLMERRGLLDEISNPPQTSEQLQDAEKLEQGNVSILALENANDDHKRQTLDLIISNIYAETKELAFRLQKPFHEVVKKRILENSGPHRIQVRTDDYVTVQL
jgi:DNA invertase Pin-like site-specific DNA recombinase